MLTILALALPETAHAFSTGQTATGPTPGCGCHGAAVASTTAVFGAAPAQVEPGDIVPLTFTVSTTDAARIAAGLNVLVSAGVLTPGADTRSGAGQITHASPQSMVSGSVTFDFTWTAPETEGDYTLSGAGNAVNLDGYPSGDGLDLAPNLVITVDDGCDDVDGDGLENCDGDCNDSDDTVFPGAIETCDGVDEDCDNETDEDAVDAVDWYLDNDGDGYGTSAITAACTPPPDHTAFPGDCDDTNPAFNPGALESDCSDPTDYNCDGSVGFIDGDQDGAAACEECDDTNASIHPGALEVCDGADNDCDGTIDAGASDSTLFYEDADLDGHGNPNVTVSACALVPGLSLSADDCDDTDAIIHPEATDPPCDGVDLDCDPTPDASTDPSCDTGTVTDTDTDTDADTDVGEGSEGDDDDDDGVGEIPVQDCGCATTSPRGGLLGLAALLMGLRARRSRR